MGSLALLDVPVELVVTVPRIDETALVPPPHDGLPVVLSVFVELTEVVRILSQSADHRLIRSLHVPLQALERKDLERLRNVKDGALLRLLVLEGDARTSSVLVLGQQVDSALLQFKEEDADVHLDAVQVLQLNFWHFHQFDEQGVDLNSELDSLGHNGQESHLLSDGSDAPRVVRVISGLGLQVRDWCELSRTEKEPPLFPVELQVLDILGGPDAGLLVPDADLDLVVLRGKDGVSKPVLDGDGVCLNL